MAVPKRNKFQYLLSFLFDSHIETRSSKYNEDLEVKYYEGGYILDAKTANFSFGTLHHVFRRAFNELRIASRPINSALILGYGAGSVAQLLNERLGKPRIVGVEIDPEVIAIARKYFELDQLDNVTVEQVDAQQYVSSCQDKFDLIAVDLFDDDRVPEQFYKEEFIKSLQNTMNPGGILVFNATINTSGQEATALLKLLEGGKSLSIETNTILAWEKPTQQ